MEVLANKSAEEWIKSDGSFENLYHLLRQKEQRIYTDEQLELLPDIVQTHPHFKEWKIRKRSSNKLINYLKSKKKPLRILEIGCGNGWLAARLAEIENTNVVAIDANEVEIKQGKKVFKKRNLRFLKARFSASIFGGQKFDVILFAASIQYFQSLREILFQVERCLIKGGEIHILDTNFYGSNGAANAMERTKAHFKKLGFPALSANYFHHQLTDLNPFNYEILYHPKALLNRIFVKNPFYWICIKPNP